MPANRFSLAFIAFIATSTLLTIGAGLSFTPKHDSSAQKKVTLWAWERNEDLSFIDPKTTEVAYFAGKVYIRGQCVSFRPRKQSLILPPNTKVTPVFRIETIRTGHALPPSDYSAVNAADAIAKQVLKTAKERTWSNEVQIDYDAVDDERVYYKSLLKQLKKKLPPKTKLSITALASWLLDDRWLTSGDADKAVAMLFSMGRSKDEIISLLKSRSLDSGAGLQVAIGISVNEKRTNRQLIESGVLKKAQSIYIFNSRPWTERQFRSFIGISEAFER